MLPQNSNDRAIVGARRSCQFGDLATPGRSGNPDRPFAGPDLRQAKTSPAVGSARLTKWRDWHLLCETAQDQHWTILVPHGLDHPTRNRILESKPAIDELRREMHRRLFRFVIQLRFVIAPIPLFVGGFVVMTDPTPWRRAALLSTFVLAVVAIASYEVRRRSLAALKLEIVMGVVGLLQLVVLFATGGIVSPVLLAMLLVCFVTSTMFTRRTSGIVVVSQMVALCIASVLEYLQPFGSLVPLPFKTVLLAGPSPALLLVYTGVAVLFFFVTREVGFRLQLSFTELVERTLQAREQSLQLHREQLAELTLLSGEIAHELKNPLASVKGLAALLAQRQCGAEPEPLTVLRREVDRMQGILEEFLNFSRPLVPLNLRTIDLSRIANEVAAMHEGLCDMRNLKVELVTHAATEVAGDPRKIRQILVNLLQNAIEASDPGARLWLRVATSEEHAEVVIEDEGTGLDPTVVGRVFEAGVTSKREGSGLGLAVARGLARQHGGDITVAERSPRGCIATLTLPRRPPVVTDGRETGS